MGHHLLVSADAGAYPLGMSMVTDFCDQRQASKISNGDIACLFSMTNVAITGSRRHRMQVWPVLFFLAVSTPDTQYESNSFGDLYCSSNFRRGASNHRQTKTQFANGLEAPISCFISAIQFTYSLTVLFCTAIDCSHLKH
jgi:hypothetical protein